MESIWNRTEKLPTFAPLARSTAVDVLVIGGGIAGLLTAFLIQKAGADVLLTEAGQIGGGITANTTAKITSQHGLIYDSIARRFGDGSARLYYDLNQRALAEYRKLSQVFPCDFDEKDAFVYTLRHPEKLQKEITTLQRLGVPASFESSVDLPLRTEGAIRFPHQAQFHPLKFLSRISRQMRIAEQTKVLGWDGETITTNRGSIRAKHIIVATHFPLFNKHGSYFLKMYQHRSYVLELEQAPLPEGMYVDESETGLSFRSYGSRLLLGGGSHRTGKEGGGWQELERFAAAYYPSARITGRWAAQDCMTLDGLPYVGQYSRRTPQLFVATGFNKWGMTSSMAAAMILRDLVQGKPNPYADLLSPSRSMLHPQLLANGFEATKNLLTPSAPRCPHLGCALKWNPQEHSWDCPCHGSRFSAEGKLLDNPATGDLKKTPKR